jgi:hypothetical protein
MPGFRSLFEIFPIPNSIIGPSGASFCESLHKDERSEAARCALEGGTGEWERIQYTEPGSAGTYACQECKKGGEFDGNLPPLGFDVSRDRIPGQASALNGSTFLSTGRRARYSKTSAMRQIRAPV